MKPHLPNSFSFCLDVRMGGLRRNVDAQAQPVGQSQCQSVLLEPHAPLTVLAQCPVNAPLSQQTAGKVSGSHRSVKLRSVVQHCPLD